MLQAASIIRDARRGAGLTQASLASRLGVPQSVVARLEKPGSNPRWETVCESLEACGRDLAVTVKPTKGSIDATQVAARLRLSPGDRLTAFERSYASLQELARAGAQARGELA